MAFDFSNRIKAIANFDVVENVKEIVDSYEDVLSRELARQIYSGKDGNGQDVTIEGRRTYSVFTIKAKLRLPGDHPGRCLRPITNYMTGEFQDNIFAFVRNKQLLFESTVPYFLDIIHQSGPALMKMQPQRMEKFKKEALIPELKRRLENGI